MQRSFNDIASTILNMNDDLVHGDFYLASVPGFTYLWLTARLPDFLAKYPGLTLRRSAILVDGNDLSVNVNVAIAHGVYQVPGRRVELLSEIGFYPICVPRFLPEKGQFEPADLKKFTLIHEDDGSAWANWFAAFGVEQGPAHRDIYAGSQPVALALAEAGVGFA
ncbi:MAG: LysR substrate-binding domain-containing protein, partial [Hyphomicrobiales bacterium]